LSRKPKHTEVNIMSPTNQKGTALITGASTGIGAVYADRLARRGYDLILVARNRERLDQVAHRVKSATGRSVEVIVADLGDTTDLSRVEKTLRENPDISLLVNNAGLGATKPLLASDVEQMDAMIALNVRAVTRLTYAAAPVFVQRKGGAIINIASVVAIAPELLNGVYGATKGFVLALSQSLRHELADKGVQIQVVLPGATATDFWAIAGRPVQELPQQIVMSSEDLVDAALAGFDQGEFVTLPALPDRSDWDAFEAARRALQPNLSHSTPAKRYGIQPRVV
jgi:short-subunit dehydrogenase